MQWDQTRSSISPHSLRIWAYHQPSDIHTLNWIRAKVRERGLIFHIPRDRDVGSERAFYSLFPIPKPDYTPLQFFLSKGWRSVILLKRSPPLPFPQFDVWSSFRICFNSIFVTSITWRLSMIYTAMFIRSATATGFSKMTTTTQTRSPPSLQMLSKVHDDIGTIFWCMIRTC